jgi:hypothetical protein
MYIIDKTNSSRTKHSVVSHVGHFQQRDEFASLNCNREPSPTQLDICTLTTEPPLHPIYLSSQPYTHILYPYHPHVYVQSREVKVTFPPASHVPTFEVSHSLLSAFVFLRTLSLHFTSLSSLWARLSGHSYVNLYLSPILSLSIPNVLVAPTNWFVWTRSALIYQRSAYGNI